MKFLQVNSTTTLNDLRNSVGTTNLPYVLASNSLPRVPNIGQYVLQRENKIISTTENVSPDFKISALNRASGDADVFERMSLMNEGGWKVYAGTNAIPGTVQIPDSITMSNSQNTLGNSRRVSKTVYTKVMDSLKKDPYFADPNDFNPYYANQSVQVADITSTGYQNLFQYFKIPWGNMTIYSSIADTFKDFPVYPEEISDSAKANYQTMPEMIYQYEPWMLYTSSGPRVVSYSFTFHRDMWTGDHRDGKANELVRFCEANCYPEYNGSAVNTSLVTLYMNGEVLIHGILTDVGVEWSGPLGLDDFYLVCKLTLSITEIAPEPLDYWRVLNKPLVG